MCSRLKEKGGSGQVGVLPLGAFPLWVSQCSLYLCLSCPFPCPFVHCSIITRVDICWAAGQTRCLQYLRVGCLGVLTLGCADAVQTNRKVACWIHMPLRMQKYKGRKKVQKWDFFVPRSRQFQSQIKTNVFIRESPHKPCNIYNVYSKQWVMFQGIVGDRWALYLAGITVNIKVSVTPWVIAHTVKQMDSCCFRKKTKALSLWSKGY